MILWILSWLVSVVAVWRASRGAKRRLELRGGLAAHCWSSVLTGVYVSYTFAPGGVSAGFTAVPTPATFGLMADLSRRPFEWNNANLNLLSLVISFIIISIVHFPFARAARQARESDRKFNERAKRKNRNDVKRTTTRHP